MASEDNPRSWYAYASSVKLERMTRSVPSLLNKSFLKCVSIRLSLSVLLILLAATDIECKRFKRAAVVPAKKHLKASSGTSSTGLPSASSPALQLNPLVRECETACSPYFTAVPLKELAVENGRTLRLSCPAVGKPRPDIEWLKDREPLRTRLYGQDVSQ